MNNASKPAALPPGQKATKAPVKVGYLNLEGGPISSPRYREGAELAVSYVNDYLNGFGGHPVQLVKCFTDGTPASSVACANQLVEDNVSLVIRGTNTNTAEAEILIKAGIPYVLAYGVGPAELNTPGLFSLTMQDGGGLGGLAKYAMERGWKKVALLPLGTPNISQFFQQFAGPVFGKAGVQHKVIFVPPGTPDPTPQLSEAMSGHPDAILFHGDANTCTSFLKAVAALGITVPLFLVGACAQKTVLTRAPAAALENTYLLSPIDLGDTGADAQTFKTVLRQHDPSGEPHNVHLRLGYLPVVALARIFTGFAGEPTAANLMKALRSAKNVPLPFGRGTVLTCDGTPIPQLASVCSPDSVLQRIEEAGKFAFVNVFNVAPMYAS